MWMGAAVFETALQSGIMKVPAMKVPAMKVPAMKVPASPTEKRHHKNTSGQNEAHREPASPDNT